MATKSKEDSVQGELDLSADVSFVPTNEWNESAEVEGPKYFDCYYRGMNVQWRAIIPWLALFGAVILLLVLAIISVCRRAIKSCCTTDPDDVEYAWYDRYRRRLRVQKRVENHQTRRQRERFGRRSEAERRIRERYAAGMAALNNAGLEPHRYRPTDGSESHDATSYLATSNGAFPNHDSDQESLRCPSPPPSYVQPPTYEESVMLQPKPEPIVL